MGIHFFEATPSFLFFFGSPEMDGIKLYFISPDEKTTFIWDVLIDKFPFFKDYTPINVQQQA